MRVPEIEKPLIALYGSSCSGKTTVAIELGKLLSISVRHCGDIVKQRAREIRCMPSQLAASVHQEVDDQTRTYVRAHREGMIVEGRFLDLVLAGIDCLTLVNLTCGTQERQNRATRAGRTMDFVRGQDENSNLLRSNLYANVKPGVTAFTISTDGLDPTVVAKLIINKIAEK